MATRSASTVLQSLVREFRAELASHRWIAFGALVALGAEVALKSLEPWPIKLVIDGVLRPKAGGPGLGRSPGTLIAIAAAALVLITAMRATAGYASTLGFSVAGNRVLSAVRIRVLDHLQRLSLAYHRRERSGDLVQRLSRDADLIKEVLVSALLPLVGNCVTLAVLAGVMVWMNWQLALVALGVLPLFLISARRLMPRIQAAARSQRSRDGAAAAALTETLGAMREVQTLALESQVSQALVRREAQSARDDVRGRILAARLERSVDVLIAVASALVLAWGAHLALQGRVSAGDLIVFLSYLKGSYKPVQDLAKYTARIAKALAASERILDTLEATPDVRDRPGAVDLERAVGRLALSQVSFGYEPSRPVLDRVSLEIEPGSMVALMGPSGHGKSTLASLLLRLYDPSRGSIALDGRDLRDYRVAAVRRQISVVPQDSLLFGVSIRENIGYGNPAATGDEIVAAARLVNADEFIARLPLGYETVLGERGATVSAGQRQRIALARAAVRNAPILILDEPTTGLDEVNRRLVIEAIVKLAKDRTALIITHDADLAERADRTLWLERGRVEERSHALR